MEADRQPNLDPERSHPDFETLEARLRRMPQPAAPNDLEAKLTAAIPARFPSRAVRTLPRWIRWWAAGAGAAAAAAVCLVLIHSQGAPDGARQSGAGPSGAMNILSQRFGICDPKETDPCNILPPLSEGR
jgi:hypothetical protein